MARSPAGRRCSPSDRSPSGGATAFQSAITAFGYDRRVERRVRSIAANESVVSRIVSHTTSAVDRSSCITSRTCSANGPVRSSFVPSWMTATSRIRARWRSMVWTAT